MKYIITAKNIQDEPHITDPLKRTEIATELISTRMKVIQLLESGAISTTDTIVTRKDRFCLYDNIFDNVMDWDHFYTHIPVIIYANPNLCIDLVSEICDGSIDTSESFEKKFDSLKEGFDSWITNSKRSIPSNSHVFNISFCKLIEYQKPFICILARGVKNNSEKNISPVYWDNLIMSIDKSRFDVFIFGETDDIYYDDYKIKKVNSFKEWCSLLANKNCKAVIAPCTGGVYPIFFVGNKDSRLIILDENSYSTTHSNSPSFYNKCVNFKNVHKEQYFYLPDPKSLAETL